jgi:hypothetical protein
LVQRSFGFRDVPERQDGCVIGMVADLEAGNSIIQSLYDFAGG